MSSSNEPPQPNPLLTAYEGFAKNTPLVTRTLLTVQVLSYALSWFADPVYALGNLPIISVEKWEIHRLFLSPLVNDHLISLLFTFWSFRPLGSRLESSMGSTAFAWLCFMLALVTNLVFDLVSYFLYALTSNKTYILASSDGMWIALFGIIALECVRAPAGTTRPFFCSTQVPVRLYPLALYLAFGILSIEFSLAFLISMGLGYLVGLGDPAAPQGIITSSFYFKTIAGACSRLILLPTFKAQQWEDRSLSHLARRQGWVAVSGCEGPAAWSSENMTKSSASSFSGMNLPLFGEQRSPTDNETVNESSNSFSRTAESSGRMLGGTDSGGGTVDERAARLQALERRQQQQQDEEEPNH